jgi:hypothetical protein
VRVEPVRWRRVGLACHKPRGPVVGVAVPLVVAGNNIKQDPVLPVRPQVLKAASYSGKHPPERRVNIGILLFSAIAYINIIVLSKVGIFYNCTPLIFI